MQHILSETVIGDGKQLIYFGTMNQRPNYWLIRIDSETNTESDDFNDNGIDEIIEILTEEFGEWNEDNEEFDPDDNCQYPIINLNAGYFWGVCEAI